LTAARLYNELELLSQISAGDEAAFTTFFHHYRNRVYSIALKISGSRAIAEEIVQDVFLKIWLKRTDLGHVQNFDAYFYIIVQNTVYKSLKRIAREHKDVVQPGKESFITIHDPEEYLVEKDYQSLLQKAINELPNQQREVYKLIREKGLKRKEVANLLNIHPETVKFHLSKAMKSLWSYCQLHLHLLFGFIVLAGSLLAFITTI
jgi:RNA polymerase sigma-70 factor (ECF subfamily)